MRIQLTTVTADRYAGETYDGLSKPLTKARLYGGLEAWLSGEKFEGFENERHSSAIRLYLRLATEGQSGLSRGVFPAAFQFSDGGHRRPDKGVIKTMLRHEMISGDESTTGELVFRVTDTGRERLNLGEF
jgi:hypothetical protein